MSVNIIYLCHGLLVCHKLKGGYHLLLVVDMCLTCAYAVFNCVDFEGILEVSPDMEVVFNDPRESFHACLSLVQHIFYCNNLLLQLPLL
jgi:hypothetical protein